VIGAWPTEPGPAELGNRDSLERLAPVRAVLPWGAGASAPPDFEAMCESAFDTEWVRSLAR
jgi:dethiobiotin synthetase